MFNDISKGLHARIQLGKQTEEQQRLLAESHKQKLESLTEECKQVFLKIKNHSNFTLNNCIFINLL